MTDNSKALDTPLKPLARPIPSIPFKATFDILTKITGIPYGKAEQFSDGILITHNNASGSTKVFRSITDFNECHPELVLTATGGVVEQEHIVSDFKPTILTSLKNRLTSKNMTLIFAAESGSRAWGFESQDSDYDIRFVYMSHPACYLSLFDPPPTITYKEHGDLLDFSGWDLRKTLFLAANSNPALLEWLGSPIIYHDDFTFCFSLKRIMLKHFSERALGHHYINFMKSIRGKYMDNVAGEYTLKRYFYALRPLLCVMWLARYKRSLPPVAFSELVTILDQYRTVYQTIDEIKHEITKLLELKKTGQESTLYKSTILDEFISEWDLKGHDLVNRFEKRPNPTVQLDQLYRQVLDLASQRMQTK